MLKICTKIIMWWLWLEIISQRRYIWAMLWKINTISSGRERRMIRKVTRAWLERSSETVREETDIKLTVNYAFLKKENE